jgi:hypothetical protein
METVLITGGTGLVGTHLARKLRQKGFRVALLSRSKKNSKETTSYFWDPEKEEIEKEALITANYIVHLAGANILEKRWTKKRKQLIIDSRVKTANLLFKKIKEFDAKPTAFISASAIGYYGSITSEHIFEESDPPAPGFLGETCRLWENAADQFSQHGIRTVKIRTSPVLAKDDGALKTILIPVRLGIAAPLGSGKQYMPWIHIDDLCNIYVKAIEDQQMVGAYNAAAPGHTTNKEFMAAVAHTLQKPFWFPNVPGVLTRILLGELGDAALKGSRISSEKIQKAGYIFQFTSLESALKDLLLPKRK